MPGKQPLCPSEKVTSTLPGCRADRHHVRKQVIIFARALRDGFVTQRNAADPVR